MTAISFEKELLEELLWLHSLHSTRCCFSHVKTGHEFGRSLDCVTRAQVTAVKLITGRPCTVCSDRSEGSRILYMRN